MSSKITKIYPIVTFIGAILAIIQFLLANTEIIYDAINQGSFYILVAFLFQMPLFITAIIMPIAIAWQNHHYHQKITTKLLLLVFSYSIFAGFSFSWAFRLLYVVVQGEWYPWESELERMFSLFGAAYLLSIIFVIILYVVFSKGNKLIFTYNKIIVE